MTSKASITPNTRQTASTSRLEFARRPAYGSYAVVSVWSVVAVAAGATPGTVVFVGVATTSVRVCKGQPFMDERAATPQQLNRFGQVTPRDEIRANEVRSTEVVQLH